MASIYFFLGPSFPFFSAHLTPVFHFQFISHVVKDMRLSFTIAGRCATKEEKKEERNRKKEGKKRGNKELKKEGRKADTHTRYRDDGKKKY